MGSVSASEAARGAAPVGPGAPVRAPGPRVVHVITSLEEGGAQAMLLKLLAARREAGGGARVVSLTEVGPIGERIAALGTPVVALRMARGRPSLAAARRLLRLLRELRPDVVQTWMYHADLLGGVAASLLGIPVLWGIRNDQLFPGDSRLTRLTRRACALLSWWIPARVICNSTAAVRTHARLGYARRKLVVIPNGFDVARFQPSAAARAAVRRELGIPEEAPLVGLVARFHPHKDHATFFAAAAAVSEQVPDVHFVLCGDGVREGDPGLVRLVEARLRPRVHLLGRRPDVERVTAALDVACLTSRTESFPNVVGEAMACGVPCVATDCGDVREILDGTGRVVPVGDVQAVAGAVIELLRLEPARRASLGEAARARVTSAYALDVVAQRFLEAQRGAMR